jgi:copper chaperone CopZ
VPGRLRVKLASIQWNEARAFTAERMLRKLDGIQSASANTLTGSVVVHFDPRVTHVAAILAALAANGFGNAKPTDPPAGKRVNRDAFATRLADKFAEKALETLVERCSLALLAALI